MAKFEVTLSDQQYDEIESLVGGEEFLNWEQATEELISMGLSAYTTEDDTGEEGIEEEMFTQAIEEQQDPAVRDESTGDDRTF
ncbi:MAG: CopG family transcriptional regulator [Halobacteriaceae archaeon]